MMWSPTRQCAWSTSFLNLYDIYTSAPKVSIKGAVTAMRYFARSKFSRRLVNQKNFSLISQVVFESGYLVRRGRIPLLSLNELREKPQEIIISSKFVSKP